jgi:hypothetical protein
MYVNRFDYIREFFAEDELVEEEHIKQEKGISLNNVIQNRQIKCNLLNRY